jgi:methionine-rich copper-binding protein CopC
MTSVRYSGARVAAWFVLGLAALVVLPLPSAVAHAELIDSDPKDSATVQTLPDQVVLEFSEEVGSPAFVDVTAADGTKVADGDPQVLGAKVEAPLTANGPPGTYTIAYRVVSADGHPISGELTFDVTTGSAGAPGVGKVRTSETPSPAAATTDDDDEGFVSGHVEHFVVAGVGLLVGGLLVGMGLRARR